MSSNQLVQCPYDPNHWVIAQRLPFHELKCRKNFRGRVPVIANPQTLVQQLQPDLQFEENGYLPPETEEIVPGQNKWPSSVSEQSYAQSHITSSSLSLFDKDSLRWERKKIEKSRVKRGLDAHPRPCSPDFEAYSALCEAIEGKEQVEEVTKPGECQLSSSMSTRGRGMPIQNDWRLAQPPGSSRSNICNDSFGKPISLRDANTRTTNLARQMSSSTCENSNSLHENTRSNENEVALTALQLMRSMRVSSS